LSKEMSDDSTRLTNALQRALSAMSDAKVPDALREIAFAKGVDFLLGDIHTSGPSPSAKERKASPPTPTEVGVKGVVQIATHLGLDEGTIERVFEVDGDNIHLVVGRKALASSKKGAQKEIAYLATAGRQAIGLDEVTNSAIVRDICDQFGVLDGSFAAALADISGRGLRVSGSGGNRTLKINKTGYETASEIVARIASEVAK
jgi:hypothetical protein